MKQPVQKRAQRTREALIAAAQELSAGGYEALRVEEIVLRAGVAKGTFFAHFPDKDALMDQLLGARIDAHLDAIAARPAPRSVHEMLDALMPLLAFMTSERYVFDLILRYSGAAAVEEIGPIARTFQRQIEIVADWVRDAPFRRDISPELIAEGVQAFAVQAMALRFCALNGGPVRDRLEVYLRAWLLPGG